MGAKLLLVDAFSHIYRSFHALPRLTAPDGQPVQAVLGFIRILRKLRREFQPTHLTAVFDRGAPQRRLTLLPSYKEQRPPTPPELESQLPYIRKAIPLLGIPVVEREGEEADDIIATLARSAAADGATVWVATNDKDLGQLVSPQIQLVLGDGRILDDAAIQQRYGVPPQQLVDLFSLAGDPVDNIAGLPGVGLKRAAELLREYGSLEQVIQAADRMANVKLAEALRSEADRLRRNRELIALRSDIPLPVTWRDLQPQPEDREGLRKLYQTLGLKTLLKDLEAGDRGSQGELF
ncbi:MAG: 5'-3' exonuclease H3TH domain-containing protein [Verrucomicrobiae bacterium]|nr:5'-3' exonuclease H3TH domain-containing protein [Verrucomicrobiae bacterium]